MGVLQTKELVIPTADQENEQRVYRVKVEEVGDREVNNPAAQTPDNGSKKQSRNHTGIKKFFSRQIVSITSSSPFRQKRKEVPIQTKLPVQKELQTGSMFKSVDHIERKLQHRKMVTSFLNSELSIDIVLMVDVTASMIPFIDEVKKVGIECLKNIKSNLHFITFRVAFVGYRDIDFRSEDQFVVMDFIEDLEAFVAKVAKVECIGGIDQTEDVFGGFDKVNTQLSWKSKTQVVIHMGDDFYKIPGPDVTVTSAPLDNHPLKKSLADAALLFSTYAKLKRFYIMGSLNERTDYMYDRFLSQAPNKELCLKLPMKDLSQLADVLVKSVSIASKETRQTSLIRPIQPNSLHNLLGGHNLYTGSIGHAFKEEDDGLNAADGSVENPELVVSSPAPTFDCPGLKEITVYPLVCSNLKGLIDLVLKKEGPNIKNPKQAIIDMLLFGDFSNCPEGSRPIFVEGSRCTIKVHDNVFAHGERHNAHYGFESINPLQLMVFKTLIDGKIVPEVRRKLAQRYAIIQDVCSMMTTIFNKRVSAKFALFSCEVKIYEDKSTGTFYICEPYLTGDFVKYNNNVGFCGDADTSSAAFKAAQAFSHFTSDYSRDKFMLVDIQGIGNKLTDVSMHTDCGCEYDGSDMNDVGIQRFFTTHNCNEVCKQLNLSNHKEESFL